MNRSQAKRLASNLRRKSPRGLCTAKVVKNQIRFSGPSGEHALDLGVSSLERIVAHWQGFCHNNGVVLEAKRSSLVVFDDRPSDADCRMVVGKLNGQYTSRRSGNRCYHVRRLRADGSLCVSNTHCLRVDKVQSYLI
jgi:hypothetical protein